ncbi:MAG: reactive intermediate/imine deaminase [Niastella sp. SCN 39-18]|nr:RidA family protein [Sphingobacteriales bacterium]ODT54023.1 MAG: reactive intermediate/imine deaminase [Niastella sp. SCN 39-18]OJW09819.1 MAG: reactive intermediate/imine deaminase [Sphingobacteriales bacterium 39-19]
MEKKIINTKEAPAPIGPYNQAVMANQFLFISGQIALDPVSGELKTDTIEEETRLVMKNLEAILNAAKLNFSQVVKTTIFLSDMQHFGLVNEIYGSYFERDFPARETVAVKTLPKNVNVEISMIACA